MSFIAPYAFTGAISLYLGYKTYSSYYSNCEFEEIEKDGRVFLSGTIIDKENVLRINCINHRRNKKDIDFLIRVLEEIGSKVEDKLGNLSV
mgnify:CR=1 FL=1